MSVLVYADFSCAYCLLASRRVDALLAAGVAVDWRAVEHRPAVAVTGERFGAGAQHGHAVALTEVRDLLLPDERLAAAPPSFLPRTEAAVSAYAEAYGAGVADDVRRVLFDLYWRDGADIGSPTVLRSAIAGPFLRARSASDPLRESGFAVSVDRGPITSEAYFRIRDWRSQWRDLGEPELPVVLVDAATDVGVDALRRLGKELVHAGAEPSPRLSDPRRYPSLPVRPDPGWVSEVGGRWRFTCRAGERTDLRG